MDPQYFTFKTHLDMLLRGTLRTVEPALGDPNEVLCHSREPHNNSVFLCHGQPQAKGEAPSTGWLLESITPTKLPKHLQLDPVAAVPGLGVSWDPPCPCMPSSWGAPWNHPCTRLRLSPSAHPSGSPWEALQSLELTQGIPAGCARNPGLEETR